MGNSVRKEERKRGREKKVSESIKGVNKWHLHTFNFQLALALGPVKLEIVRGLPQEYGCIIRGFGLANPTVSPLLFRGNPPLLDDLKVVPVGGLREWDNSPLVWFACLHPIIP